MKEYVPKRIERLQASLREMGLDACMFYDRENLIYFAGVDDLEGGALVVPASGEPELFCLWLDRDHFRETSGIEKVTPYYFPKDNQSTMMGKWLKNSGLKAPKIGFTRYFISLKDYQCLMDAAPDMVVSDIAILCYKLRSIKDQEEISLIQKASDTLAMGMDAAVKAARHGVSEVEILAEAAYAMQKAGSQGSPFRMQVLTKSRQMLMHPYASEAIIENNAPLVIHLGASIRGYTSKMCRTIFLGDAPEESIKIYDILAEAQQIAMDIIKPGTTCGEVFDTVENFVAESGYEKSWIMEHIGYGVGIRQSEFHPIIAKGSETVLEENMVIDLLLPTIYVKNAGGPRITDVILTTKAGTKKLTNYPKIPTNKK